MSVDPRILSDAGRPLLYPAHPSARAAVATYVARSCFNLLPAGAQVMVWDQLTIDGKAVLDLTVEAMMIVNLRSGEQVEQIERGRWRYSAHGSARTLSDRQLLVLAGLDEGGW